MTYTPFFVLYSAHKGQKAPYIVYICSFSSFFPIWCGKRYVWECASDTFRPSPPPVTPQTPPEGGQGGGFDWSVATHRSPRPQDERPEHRRERAEKNHRRAGERGRTHWERAESKEPPAHSSKGDFFFRKRAVLAQRRGLYAGTSRGEENSERDSGAVRASFFEGCGRGTYRYMAMSQYSVLCACPASLSTAIALA